MSSPASARDLYLASLPPQDELCARRAAERAGLPDDDPTWLLLAELQRARRETARCSSELTQAVAQAVTRVECVASGGTDDASIARAATALGTTLASDDRVVDALTLAITHMEQDALRALHAFETRVREAWRQRAYAPMASLLFAFALGIISSTLALWATYHVALGYGRVLGYHAGVYDAHTYDRSHP